MLVIVKGKSAMLRARFTASCTLRWCRALRSSGCCLLSAVSRQRANRALHALEQAGLLRVEFGGVTVLDVPGLWRFGADPGP